MGEKPEILSEELANFRRCRFGKREFMSYPSLWSKQPFPDEKLPPDSRDKSQEWHASKPYNGEPFDPDEYELRDGGWDHEHCDVCWFKIEEGTAYWTNLDADAGHVDLCEKCYPQIMELLGSAE